MRKIYIIPGASRYTLGIRTNGAFKHVNFEKFYGEIGCRVKVDDEPTQEAIEAHDMFKSGSIEVIVPRVVIEVQPEIIEAKIFDIATQVENQTVADEEQTDAPVVETVIAAPGEADPSTFTTITEVKNYLNKEHGVIHSRLQNVEAVKSVIREKGLYFPNVKSLN